MNITRMNHAAVNVLGHMPEAREFYLEVLGLPEVPIQIPGREPVTGSEFGFWVEKQGVQMHVIGREPLGGSPEPTHFHVSWYVSDIQETVGELEAREIPMRVMGEGDHRIVWIHDPCGNIMEFQQDPEAQA